jgi:hypothetical protein
MLRREKHEELHFLYLGMNAISNLGMNAILKYFKNTISKHLNATPIFWKKYR